MVLNKYAVAIIQILTVAVTALVAAQSDGLLEPVEVWQVAGIAVGGVAAYFVPLLENGWAATLKFVATLVGAGIAAVVPIIDTANGGPGWSASAILIVLLAVLNAALTALGVTVRLESAKAALAAQDVSDQVPVAVDGKAVKVVLAHGRVG